MYYSPRLNSSSLFAYSFRLVISIRCFDSSSEEEDEDDFEQTNPLLEQIRESGSRALSATGMDVQENKLQVLHVTQKL